MYCLKISSSRLQFSRIHGSQTKRDHRFFIKTEIREKERKMLAILFMTFFYDSANNREFLDLLSVGMGEFSGGKFNIIYFRTVQNSCRMWYQVYSMSKAINRDARSCNALFISRHLNQACLQRFWRWKNLFKACLKLTVCKIRSKCLVREPQMLEFALKVYFSNFYLWFIYCLP